MSCARTRTATFRLFLFSSILQLSSIFFETRKSRWILEKLAARFWIERACISKGILLTKTVFGTRGFTWTVLGGEMREFPFQFSMCVTIIALSSFSLCFFSSSSFPLSLSLFHLVSVAIVVNVVLFSSRFAKRLLPPVTIKEISLHRPWQIQHIYLLL